jgi:hypothetical protein
VLRLRGGPLAGHGATSPALLEALLAAGAVTDPEHELLYRLLRAHHRLTHGYAPESDAALTPAETAGALALMVHMLEGLHLGTIGI